MFHIFYVLSRYEEDDSIEVMINCLEELRRLLVYIGRVSSLSDLLLQDSQMNNNSALPSFYHLCLDTWWLSLVIASVAERRGITGNGNQIIADTTFVGTFSTQIEKLLLADLITLSLRRHVRLSAIGDNSAINHFSCECIQELFTMLRIYVDRSSNQVGSFWKQMNNVIDNYKITTEQKDSERLRTFALVPLASTNQNIKDLDVFTLWLIAGLCKIYNHSDHGDYSGCSEVPGNITAMTATSLSLIKTEESLKSRGISFKVINALIYTEICCQAWVSTLDLLFPFLEYYMKRLNKPDTISFGLETVQDVPKSGHIWVHSIKNYSQFKSSDRDFFHMLLNLFGTSVTKLLKTKNAHTTAELQRLKGRLYSKIQPRRLEDLNEAGMYRFFSFFLIFSYTAPDYWQEICGKLCEIAKTIVQKFLDHAKASLLLKCLFAHLYLRPASANASKLLAIISVIAERVVNQLCNQDVIVHSSTYNNLNNNVLVYLEEIRLMNQELGDLQPSDYQTQNRGPKTSMPHLALKEESRNLMQKIMEKLISANFSTYSKLEELLQVFFQDMRQEGDNWLR